MKKHLNISTLAWAIVVLIGIILCIRELREPDLWWQLRAGEWMLENSSITRNDMFSFTHAGVPWINVKWGYEVIIASIEKFTGPEGVMMLQMVSVLTIILFLFKSQKIAFTDKPNSSSGIIVSLFLFLIIHASRINGRPEMTTYALTSVYLYLLFRYHNKSDNSIFLLIPIQIFWTNMHEAYGVGVIMLTIFTISTLSQNYFAKKKGINKSLVSVKKLVVVNLLLLATLIVNPNGYEMLGHYLEIYSQLQENKFTTENYSFKSSDYWTYASVLNLLIFIYTFHSLFLKNQKWKIKQGILNSINNYGLWYIMLYFAFFYLSLQATRNTFFFTCIAFPVFCNSISDWMNARFSKEKTALKVAAVIGIILYISIGSGLFYKALLEREQYGLKISSKRNAIGASSFIKKHNIKGKAFVDYLNSSYLLWDHQPEFKTYLDLRDFDIFTQKFMSNVFDSYVYPDAQMPDGSSLWNAMVKEDSFEYVIVSNNQQFGNFHRYLIYQDSSYNLVYADGVASVYLARNERNIDLINELAYNNGEKDVFHNFTEVKTNGPAKYITRLFWPFYKEHKVSNKEQRRTKIAYYRIITAN